MEQAHLKMLPTDRKTKVQILIVGSERTSRLDGELGYSKSPSRVRRESSTHTEGCISALDEKRIKIFQKSLRHSPMLPLPVSSRAMWVRAKREYPEATLIPPWLGSHLHYLLCLRSSRDADGSITGISDRFDVDSCQRPTEEKFVRTRISGTAAPHFICQISILRSGEAIPPQR